MRIGFYGIVPVIYVNKIRALFSKGRFQSGMSMGYFIVIDKTFHDNESMHVHELRHIKQNWVVGFLLSLLATTVFIGCDQIFYQTLNFVLYWKYYYFIGSLLSPIYGMLLYLLNKRYRYWAEVDAFRAELKVISPEKKALHAMRYSVYITEYYGLAFARLDETIKKLL